MYALFNPLNIIMIIWSSQIIIHEIEPESRSDLLSSPISFSRRMVGITSFNTAP